MKPCTRLRQQQRCYSYNGNATASNWLLSEARTSQRIRVDESSNSSEFSCASRVSRRISFCQIFRWSLAYIMHNMAQRKRFYWTLPPAHVGVNDHMLCGVYTVKPKIVRKKKQMTKNDHCVVLTLIIVIRISLVKQRNVFFFISSLEKW